jgi:hypothetical protein
MTRPGTGNIDPEKTVGGISRGKHSGFLRAVV